MSAPTHSPTFETRISGLYRSMPPPRQVQNAPGHAHRTTLAGVNSLDSFGHARLEARAYSIREYGPLRCARKAAPVVRPLVRRNYEHVAREAWRREAAQ